VRRPLPVGVRLEDGTVLEWEAIAANLQERLATLAEECMRSDHEGQRLWALRTEFRVIEELLRAPSEWLIGRGT
jgi:hypothetical protein